MHKMNEIFSSSFPNTAVAAAVFLCTQFVYRNWPKKQYLAFLENSEL